MPYPGESLKTHTAASEPRESAQEQLEQNRDELLAGAKENLLKFTEREQLGIHWLQEAGIDAPEQKRRAELYKKFRTELEKKAKKKLDAINQDTGKFFDSASATGVVSPYRETKEQIERANRIIVEKIVEKYREEFGLDENFNEANYEKVQNFYQKMEEHLETTRQMLVETFRNFATGDQPQDRQQVDDIKLNETEIGQLFDAYALMLSEDGIQIQNQEILRDFLQNRGSLNEHQIEMVTYLLLDDIESFLGSTAAKSEGITAEKLSNYLTAIGLIRGLPPHEQKAVMQKIIEIKPKLGVEIIEQHVKQGIFRMDVARDFISQRLEGTIDEDARRNLEEVKRKIEAGELTELTQENRALLRNAALAENPERVNPVKYVINNPSRGIAVTLGNVWGAMGVLLNTVANWKLLKDLDFATFISNPSLLLTAGVGLGSYEYGTHGGLTRAFTKESKEDKKERQMAEKLKDDFEFYGSIGAYLRNPEKFKTIKKYLEEKEKQHKRKAEAPGAKGKAPSVLELVEEDYKAINETPGLGRGADWNAEMEALITAFSGGVNGLNEKESVMKAVDMYVTARALSIMYSKEAKAKHTPEQFNIDHLDALLKRLEITY